jgi:hypothetical protein
MPHRPEGKFNKVRKALKKDLRTYVAEMKMGAIAPFLEWQQGEDEQWTPVVVVANIVLPFDSRPFQGFFKNERLMILTAIQQTLSELLFDCPRFIHSATRVAANPDWDLLPYFEETSPGTFTEVHPEASLLQEQAGDELPTE